MQHVGIACALSEVERGSPCVARVTVGTLFVENLLLNGSIHGDADNSVLYEALASTISLDDNWKHNHANIMTTDRAGLQLIKDWIDNGAKE